MDIKQLLEELDGNRTISIERAIEILDREEILDEDDENAVKLGSIETMYGEYPCIKYSYYIIIKGEVYEEYCKDLAREMGQQLPDGLDAYFNHEELGEHMVNDFVEVQQVQEFLEHLGEDTESFEDIDPIDDGCYLIREV